MKEVDSEEEVPAEIPHTFRNLGRSLTLLRDLRKVSLRATARKAGVRQSQLSKYENARILPRLESLEKILKALGVTPLDLFNAMALFDLSKRRCAPGQGRSRWSSTSSTPEALSGTRYHSPSGE